MPISQFEQASKYTERYLLKLSKASKITDHAPRLYSRKYTTYIPSHTMNGILKEMLKNNPATRH